MGNTEAAGSGSPATSLPSALVRGSCSAGLSFMQGHASCFVSYAGSTSVLAHPVDAGYILLKTTRYHDCHTKDECSVPSQLDDEVLVLYCVRKSSFRSVLRMVAVSRQPEKSARR